MKSRERRAATGVALTPREIAVLALLAQGLQSKEIAKDLGLSTETIRTRLQMIYAKLGVHTRSHAVAEAIRAGLI